MDDSGAPYANKHLASCLVHAAPHSCWGNIDTKVTWLTLQTNRFKKFIMKTMWRVQQSQMVISVVFWSLTLTGIFYDKVSERFDNFGLPRANVFGGMAVMFTMVVLLIVTFGFCFDKFQFWKEQQVVIIERNPFASKGRMHPNQTVYWSAVAELLPEGNEKRKNLEYLIQQNLEIPEVRKEVQNMLDDSGRNA